MKKFLALMLALVMALSLVACGGSSEPTAEGGDTQTEDAPQFEPMTWKYACSATEGTC